MPMFNLLTTFLTMPMFNLLTTFLMVTYLAQTF